MAGRSSSLLEAIDFWGETSPSKTALTFLNDSGLEVDALTYADILARSSALASHLLENVGLTKGSTCLLVYPPCLDFTVAYLACLRAGVIAVPCFPPDPRRLKKDLHMFTAIQGSSGATVALTSSSYNYAKKMSDIKGMFTGGAAWPELNWVVTDSLPLPSPKEGDSYEFNAPEADDVAFLQYTSGKIEPKGVMITHDNLADNLKLIITGLKATDDTVVVGWLPQYHDMGLIGSVLALLFCGGSGFYMSPVSFVKRPALWVELISRHRGTHMQAPNFAFGLTARKFLALEEQPQLDLSCVRHMINAAEPVDTASMDRFYAVFEAHGLKRGVIFPTYGLAEHTVYVCSNGRARLVVDRIMLENDRKIRPVENKLEMWAYGIEGGGTLGGKDDGVLTTSMVGCGRPADSEGVDLRIVDTETGLSVPEGNVGEIWVTSRSRAAGYWSRPDKTNEDFGGRLAGEGENGQSSGYLRTGDLGFLWDGELYICGRIKDLVIVRGRNHYPQDIEKSVEAAVAGAVRWRLVGRVGVYSCRSWRWTLASLQCRDEARRVCTDQGGGGEGGGLTPPHVVPCAVPSPDLTNSFPSPPYRTIPKTTSGKIARAMCKRAHTSGALDADTVLLWGEAGATSAAEDARALAAEAPSSPGGEGEGVEESKVQPLDDGGGRGCATDMPVELVLKGVQNEVARILKADPSSIPTDAPLGALGLDSMEAMQLMALLEERFNVKLPDDVMMEADTTLTTLAPIIKSGGAVPPRMTAVDCGLLAALESKEGPPKGYMVEAAVAKKKADRLAESSFKTTLETGKFKPGCLSEKAKMTAADTALARGSLFLFAAVDFVTPVAYLLLLFLALRPLWSSLFSEGEMDGTVLSLSLKALQRVVVLLVSAILLPGAMATHCRRFPPAGAYSRVRAHLVKYLGVRVVVEGKQTEEKPCVYVGVGLGVPEQLLLASVAPSALSRPVRPTTPPATFLPSLLLSALDGLLGSTGKEDTATALKAALEVGESACVDARVPTAAGMAPAVALAMRNGAQIVPCAVLGGGGGGAEGGGRFSLAMAAVAWGLGPRPGGVVVICAAPVRVPFTAEPTQKLVMEFAEAARVSAAKALSDHSEAFFGVGASKKTN
eukprot:jgi/Undpi1/780/HiC_scaffold_10.g04244.m1